jgi:hypothetical protein
MITIKKSLVIELCGVAWLCVCVAAVVFVAIRWMQEARTEPAVRSYLHTKGTWRDAYKELACVDVVH